MKVTDELVRAEWTVSQFKHYRYLGREDWCVTVEFGPDKPDHYWVHVYTWPVPAQLEGPLSVDDAFNKAVKLREAFSTAEELREQARTFFLDIP